MSVGILAGPDERLPGDLPAAKPAPERGLPASALASRILPAPVRPGPAPVLPAMAVTEAIGVGMRDEGIIEVTLPPDQVIKGRQACAARAAVRSLADGRRLPVLLVVTGVLDISVEARKVYANSEAPSAFALVGESPVDRVIAHYLLRWTTETTPAQFFTSQPDAIRWLRQYARED